jgi:hypothetical protein
MYQADRSPRQVVIADKLLYAGLLGNRRLHFTLIGLVDMRLNAPVRGLGISVMEDWMDDITIFFGLRGQVALSVSN